MIQVLSTVFRRYPFEQKRMILAVLVGVVGVGLGAQFVVTADLAAIHRNAALFLEQSRKEKSLAEVAGYQTQVESHRTELTPRREADWMMEAVRGAVTASGLSLVSVSPQNPEKDENFEKLSLSVEAEGGYHQVGHFIEVLENHKPFIFLTHLRLEKGAAPEGRRIRVFAIFSAYREIVAGAQ